MALARIIVCLLGLSTIVLAAPNSRILEGSEAKGGEVPQMASVRLDNAHVCGGTIISEHHILTAGHCVSQMGTVSYDPTRISARVGSINQFAGGKIHNVKSVNIHPSYGNFLHDVAVLEVTEPFAWGDKVKAAVLPAAAEVVAEGTAVDISGWGLEQTGASPYKLQHATLRTLSQEECNYRAGFGYDSVLCLDHAVGQGICRGDEGAGVTIGSKVIGVASFPFGACGTKYPDVAANVAYYREWLDRVLAA